MIKKLALLLSFLFFTSICQAGFETEKLGILEPGEDPEYASYFQGADQAGNVTYTLPAALPSGSSKFLKSTIDGILSWESESDPLAWLTGSDQTGLTGDKSGSFDISTSGTVLSNILSIYATINHSFYNSSDDLYISNPNQDKKIVFIFNDGGVTKTLTLDASQPSFGSDAVDFIVKDISYGGEIYTSGGTFVNSNRDVYCGTIDMSVGAGTITGWAYLEDTLGAFIFNSATAVATINNELDAFILNVGSGLLVADGSSGQITFGASIDGTVTFNNTVVAHRFMTDSSLFDADEDTGVVNILNNLTVGNDFEVGGGTFGYHYATDIWTLGYLAEVDYIEGYSYNQRIIFYDYPTAIGFSTDLTFPEEFDATIYVQPATGTAYEGSHLTLKAGDGLTGAPNATGGSLIMYGGASTGSTSGEIQFGGSIQQDLYDSSIDNTQVYFMMTSAGRWLDYLPMLVSRGTGTQYKNLMVCYTYNGASFTSRSSECRTAFGTAFTLLADTNDYVYVGLQSFPFSTVYFDLASNGSGLTVLWEYWNGSDWVDLDGVSGPPLLADTTNNFSQSGYVTVDTSFMSDWTANAVSGTTAYWLRASTSAITTAPTCFKTGTVNYSLPILAALTDTSNYAYYANWNGYNGIRTTSPQAVLDVFTPNLAGIIGLRVSVDGTGSTGDAHLQLYRSSTLYGDVWYDGSVGDLYIDNSYNNTAAEIYFRLKTAGTPLNALILKDTAATFNCQRYAFNTTTDTSSTVKIAQIDDADGIITYGYDDMAAKYYHTYIDSSGYANQYSNDLILVSAQSTYIGFWYNLGFGIVQDKWMKFSTSGSNYGYIKYTSADGFMHYGGAGTMTKHIFEQNMLLDVGASSYFYIDKDDAGYAQLIFQNLGANKYQLGLLNTENFGLYDSASSSYVLEHVTNSGGFIMRDELDILSTSDPQLRLTHTDGVDECDFFVDSDGDLFITSTSGNHWLGDGGDVDYTLGFYGATSQGVITYMEDEAYFSIDKPLQLPYLGDAPANLANGMIWMEADGLHIYYNNAEKVVAGT